MDISITKLQKELCKRQSKSKSNSTGYGKVILNLWNLEDAMNIDFDAFTLEDIENAIEEFHHLPMDSQWDEDFICDPNNDFVTCFNQRELIYSFIENKQKKYLPYKDDIFI